MLAEVSVHFIAVICYQPVDKIHPTNKPGKAISGATSADIFHLAPVQAQTELTFPFQRLELTVVLLRSTALSNVFDTNVALYSQKS